MASLLAELVPEEEEQAVEIQVDSLTPTQIADAYMNSKINSVRIALLRGYNVPEEERELVENLRLLPRTQALSAFINHYIEGRYFPLSNLNASYQLGEDRENVVGLQPQVLIFHFYTTDGPDEREIAYVPESEMVFIGHGNLNNTIYTRIVTHARNAGIKVSRFVTEQLTTWPLDNPYAPSARVYKRVEGGKYQGLGDILADRGISSPDQLNYIELTDPVARLYGMDEGDLMVETRLAVDMAAIAKRIVEIRLAVKPSA
jgi:hypothetical protein